MDRFFVRPKTSTCLDDPACRESWTIDENLHPQPDPRGTLTLATAMETAPKLAAIAESILSTPIKTLVLLHSRLGAPMLAALLVREGVSVVYLRNTETLPPADQRIARAENAIRLHAFNHADNRRGDRYRVAVAEAEEYSEGVSFMHVRRVILDQGYGFAAGGWAAMEQKIGRALRSCSHEGLPPSMRTLQVDVFVVVHNQTKYPPTIDQEKYEAVMAEVPQVEAGLAFLRDRSIDAAYYAASPTA